MEKIINMVTLQVFTLLYVFFLKDMTDKKIFEFGGLEIEVY